MAYSFGLDKFNSMWEEDCRGWNELKGVRERWNEMQGVGRS